MVDIKWKVNKCCHQNHFCIPVNIISLPDPLYFYISPDTKVLSHFVPLLVSCRPEHLVNSCVLCSPVAQMVQLVSNSSLSTIYFQISKIMSVATTIKLRRTYRSAHVFPGEEVWQIRTDSEYQLQISVPWETRPRAHFACTEVLLWSQKLASEAGGAPHCLRTLKE